MPLTTQQHLAMVEADLANAASTESGARLLSWIIYGEPCKLEGPADSLEPQALAFREGTRYAGRVIANALRRMDETRGSSYFRRVYDSRYATPTVPEKK